MSTATTTAIGIPVKSLEWREREGYREARLDNPNGSPGVFFTLSRHPTCHRRGQYRLLIEVCGGPYHEAWGCFDHQDMPMRYYHFEATAKIEAEAIATVLQQGFNHRAVKREP